MPERAIRTVLDGMSYLEGPRWHDGRLYVSDFYTGAIVAVDLDGGAEPETVATVPEQPSGLGWMPDGSLLVVSMRDRRLLRFRDGGEPEVHADLSDARAVAPQRHGRRRRRAAPTSGNFGFDLMAGGADPRGGASSASTPTARATVAAEDLLFPNGTVITPDARTLIVAETLGGRLTAFDLGDDGTLSNRRVWAKLSPAVDTEDMGELLAAGGVAPDGTALDAEGASGRPTRSAAACCACAEGGEILEEIAPGTGVFACALGGAEGRTLVMCAAPSFAEHERRDTREAVLLACEVDVPRAGLP